ncbi:zf-C2HC5 domain-containing protein [Pseudozyma hubeiensis]|nr:zf-C2HC5 domain-containing protein [Pseudozyma hubeiensis]
MAKGSSIWIDQLVSLLGLDKETAQTQILPFLDSFDDEASLRLHLQGLVGTDSPLAKSFVRDFVHSRFPQQASTSGSTTPTLSSASSTAPKNQRKRGKKTLAERAGIGQTLPPRKVQESDVDEEEQMQKLAEAFGGMGTVYRKKQDEDDFFAGTKGKKPKQTAHRQEASITNSTPPSQLDSASAFEHTPTDIQNVGSTMLDEPSSSTTLNKTQPSPPPTAEMLAIDAVVEELTSTSSASTSSTLHRKMCFCQGRRHALAPYAPLCYSCGLILCSAIQPSPLSPLSSCPSCSSSPLLGAAARSDLIAKLTAERDILFDEQLLQIQLQREQKKLNKTAARSAREQEAALFPQLGKEASSSAAATNSVPMTAPVMGKHGALQKAKAIAGDAQRTAKVLSLDMKTHKVKTHTKVARPKPALKPEVGTKVEIEEEKEEMQNPFVGLDGSALVRNETDDGLRVERVDRANGRANAKAKSTKGAMGIPPRTWIFAGRSFHARPTPPVQ